MSTCVALITARGGSKGLPGKNIRLIGGKPLIVWTIEAALRSRSLERVIVSTDSEEIAVVARNAGAEVPFLRPAELARDDSPHILSSHHVLQWLAAHDQARPDYLMLLQPTSPFRTTSDIDAALALADEKSAIAVVSVSEAHLHPLKTYRLSAEGTLVPFIPNDITYRRRQALPPVYCENGAIYLNRSDSLLTDRTYIPAGAIPYVMPAERALDIDSAWDALVADAILRDPAARSALAASDEHPVPPS